jgi:3'(2'), 5'-bisphosphate nucleotidase
MHLQTLGRDAALAAETVRDAVGFVRTVQDTSPRALTKADASLVTVVDFALQALLASRLERDFPGDPIVAEEDATALRVPAADALAREVVEVVKQVVPGANPEQVLTWIDRGRGTCGYRFWTLDPIDGTKGLLRGGQYVIALALVIDGQVQIAVIGCPRLLVTTGLDSSAVPVDSLARAVVVSLEDDTDGGVVVAVRDRGAWWMSLRGGVLMRLSVSTETNPTRARALHSYEAGHADVRQFHRTLQTLGTHAPPILMDSQAKHVLLAAGAAELLLRLPIDRAYHEAIWDQAAGSLIIEEAGGRVTDIEGRSLDFTTGRRLLRNTGLVASNSLLHEAVLDVIGQRSLR